MCEREPGRGSLRPPAPVRCSARTSLRTHYRGGPPRRAEPPPSAPQGQNARCLGRHLPLRCAATLFGRVSAATSACNALPPWLVVSRPPLPLRCAATLVGCLSAATSLAVRCHPGWLSLGRHFPCGALPPWWLVSGRSLSRIYAECGEVPRTVRLLATWSRSGRLRNWRLTLPSRRRRPSTSRGVAPEVSAQRGTSGATNGGGGPQAPPTRLSFADCP
jgi:hypothetical protein